MRMCWEQDCAFIEERQRRLQQVKDVLEPLGFYHTHSLIFEHKHTGHRFNLVSLALTKENIINYIINETFKLGYDQGKTDTQNDIKNALGIN